jgi:hypothetical protein
MDNMEVVLIDRFIVAEDSKAEFVSEVHKSTAFLRTMPGFIMKKLNVEIERAVYRRSSY